VTNQEISVLIGPRSIISLDNRWKKKMENRSLESQTKQPAHISKLFTTPFVFLYVVLFAYWGVFMRIPEYTRSAIWDQKAYWFGRLSQGWFMGRKIDLTDDQWKGFRGHFPMLVAGMLVYALLTGLIKKFLCKSSKLALLLFYSISPMIALYFCFGYTLIFPILIALTNFGIAKVFGGHRLNPILTWALVLFVIFSTELQSWRFEQTRGSSYAWLDANRGFLTWNVYFKITICRLVSFNVDYFNNFHHVGVDNIPKYETFTDYRKRSEQKLAPSSYSFLMYWSYVFYLPLYLAGPISFYNSWASYIERPQTEWNHWKSAKELIKLVVYYIAFEIFLHYFYVSAIAYNRLWSTRYSDYWKGIGMEPLSHLEIFILCCHVCICWWLKFLIIWRTFRIWAILDGVYVPDNMSRCLYNMTFFKQFWRNWHITFYQWSLRYIYIPLGGERSKYWSIWLLFGFSAIWHDLWWRWFLWAIFNCCCIVVEAIILWYIAQPKVAKILNGSPWSSYIVELVIRAIGIQVLAICQQSVHFGNDIFELIWMVYMGPGAWWFFFVYALPMGMVLAIFQVEYDRTYGSG
jgi:D-alanyl-lipoteichoic acid acyltransferase DltB (MBOAT superfamily)